MPITIARFDASHLEGVLALCRTLGWPSYAGDRQRTREALAAPGAVTRVALDGDDVVGLVHVLGNGHVRAHLSLVGVLPGVRRQGIGRRLVTEAFAASGCRWLDLVADPGSEPFYRSFLHQERTGFRIHPGDPPSDDPARPDPERR